ncbi:aspartate-semialdehyde dehydrogenase [Erythrobacter insulae]|uniref:Aspartate-semialdehyde dehydrogenase n=1 Tax=Erythrobacter insulae TaxID=2584124 RepID=A0A547PE63_9SPHN|nr:aspartate-semialdehyde dehydrogenase [Erythrobacter insulae]TRD12426.1 aspartate-semialdehyde dehydrogenase [Erythrobacter insulae]
MRIWALSIAMLAVAACDSGNVPPPSSQSELRASTPYVEVDEVALRGDGITAGTESFYFAAGQNEVEGALEQALGDPGDKGENGECGAGAMAFASYPGGLTVNFQGGSLVGWNWDSDADNISLNGDYRIGTLRTEIEALDGFVMIEDSTLGEEFALGDRIGGFFEGDAVSMFYAGTQCFFR